MANHLTSGFENTEEIEDLEKKIKDLKETVVPKQNDRVDKLQTSAFSLANYYFVFQGVIFGQIISGTSACSARWLIFLLSLIVSIVNLFSLLLIGRKYKSSINQRDQAMCECDTLLSKLRKQQTSQNSDHPTTSAATQHREVASSQDPAGGQAIKGDTYKKRQRDIYYMLCMGLFVIFAIGVVVGCWIVPCNRPLQCKSPTSKVSSDKCIRLCEGAKCTSICAEY